MSNQNGAEVALGARVAEFGEDSPRPPRRSNPHDRRRPRPGKKLPKKWSIVSHEAREATKLASCVQGEGKGTSSTDVYKVESTKQKGQTKKFAGGVKMKNPVDFNLGGTQMTVPPPREPTTPRAKPEASPRRTLMSNSGVYLMEGDQVDDQQSALTALLACRRFGVPIEIRRNRRTRHILATPLFHCRRCWAHWENSGNLPRTCNMARQTARGQTYTLTFRSLKLLQSRTPDVSLALEDSDYDHRTDGDDDDDDGVQADDESDVSSVRSTVFVLVGDVHDVQNNVIHPDSENFEREMARLFEEMDLSCGEGRSSMTNSNDKDAEKSLKKTREDANPGPSGFLPNLDEGKRMQLPGTSRISKNAGGSSGTTQNGVKLEALDNEDREGKQTGGTARERRVRRRRSRGGELGSYQGGSSSESSGEYYYSDDDGHSASTGRRQQRSGRSRRSGRSSRSGRSRRRHMTEGSTAYYDEDGQRSELHEDGAHDVGKEAAAGNRKRAYFKDHDDYEGTYGGERGLNDGVTRDGALPKLKRNPYSKEPMDPKKLPPLADRKRSAESPSGGARTGSPLPLGMGEDRNAFSPSNQVSDPRYDSKAVTTKLPALLADSAQNRPTTPGGTHTLNQSKPPMPKIGAGKNETVKNRTGRPETERGKLEHGKHAVPDGTEVPETSSTQISRPTGRPRGPVKNTEDLKPEAVGNIGSQPAKASRWATVRKLMKEEAVKKKKAVKSHDKISMNDRPQNVQDAAEQAKSVRPSDLTADRPAQMAHNSKEIGGASLTGNTTVSRGKKQRRDSSASTLRPSYQPQPIKPFIESEDKKPSHGELKRDSSNSLVRRGSNAPALRSMSRAGGSTQTARLTMVSGQDRSQNVKKRSTQQIYIKKDRKDGKQTGRSLATYPKKGEDSQYKKPSRTWSKVSAADRSIASRAGSVASVAQKTASGRLLESTGSGKRKPGMGPGSKPSLAVSPMVNLARAKNSHAKLQPKESVEEVDDASSGEEASPGSSRHRISIMLENGVSILSFTPDFGFSYYGLPGESERRNPPLEIAMREAESRHRLLRQSSSGSLIPQRTEPAKPTRKGVRLLSDKLLRRLTTPKPKMLKTHSETLLNIPEENIEEEIGVASDIMDGTGVLDSTYVIESAPEEFDDDIATRSSQIVKISDIQDGTLNGSFREIGVN